MENNFSVHSHHVSIMWVYVQMCMHEELVDCFWNAKEKECRNPDFDTQFAGCYSSLYETLSNWANISRNADSWFQINITDIDMSDT